MAAIEVHPLEQPIGPAQSARSDVAEYRASAERAIRVLEALGRKGSIVKADEGSAFEMPYWCADENGDVFMPEYHAQDALKLLVLMRGELECFWSNRIRVESPKMAHAFRDVPDNASTGQRMFAAMSAIVECFLLERGK